MRIVVALGGNALLKRGEALTAENQRRNMHTAALGLARICEGNEVAIVHGNGPQVGLLALEADAYKAVPPYPLDVLGAESQGMIGYVIVQELRNAMPDRQVAAVLTQVVVDPDDPGFANPAKPIGPVYAADQVDHLRHQHGWTFAPDGLAIRRVVASPQPIDIVECDMIKTILHAGAVAICAGGGGIPVTRDASGKLSGVEAVIDKDLTAALLAERVEADRLIILTDVEAVFSDWGGANERAIREASVAEIKGMQFASGSMAPKIEAACHFAEASGEAAMIGSLQDAEAVMAGKAGTRVTPS